MSFRLIADLESATALTTLLASNSRVALDCEAAGFHRYSDRICLIQLTVESETFIVDPLAFDPKEVIRPALENENVQVVMHGADYDVRLLNRDLGIQLRGIFDTQIAASLLGEPGLGLAALLQKHLAVNVSKKFQRADWARRPLPPDMLEYAASDTRHLATLASLLEERLLEEGRMTWAQEEFRAMEATRWEKVEDEDPVARVKGARDLPPRQVTALREALRWRDRVARRKDRAPFRVAGDEALLETVLARPRSVKDLAALKGFNPRLAHSEGKALLDRLYEVEGLELDELVGFPTPARNGRGRPSPTVEERLDRLKSVRNSRAEELRIGRGTLVPNSVLLEIAWDAPRTLEDLGRIEGIKSWQVDTVGRAMLDRMAT